MVVKRLYVSREGFGDIVSVVGFQGFFYIKYKEKPEPPHLLET